MGDAIQPLSNPQQLPQGAQEEDLRPWGYAPGFYSGRCIDCPTGDVPSLPRLMDKRAYRCREHALAARCADQAAEVERLTPYVEGYRREERRADELEEKLEEAVTALRAVWRDLKQLADSGDAGNWSAEDSDSGKLALACLAKHEGGSQ